MATTWCCPASLLWSCQPAGTPAPFHRGRCGLTGTSASDMRSPKPWAKITLTSCDSLKPVKDGVVSGISAGPVGPVLPCLLDRPRLAGGRPTTAAEAKGLTLSRSELLHHLKHSDDPSTIHSDAREPQPGNWPLRGSFSRPHHTRPPCGISRRGLHHPAARPGS